jgi:hypothetical protein
VTVRHDIQFSRRMNTCPVLFGEIFSVRVRTFDQWKSDESDHLLSGWVG